MGQILHKRATTTHEIRNKIRQEQCTTNSIAKKYNIAYYTAKKWKNRDSIEDKTSQWAMVGQTQV